MVNVAVFVVFEKSPDAVCVAVMIVVPAPLLISVYPETVATELLLELYRKSPVEFELGVLIVTAELSTNETDGIENVMVACIGLIVKAAVTELAKKR